MISPELKEASEKQIKSRPAKFTPEQVDFWVEEFEVHTFKANHAKRMLVNRSFINIELHNYLFDDIRDDVSA